MRKVKHISATGFDLLTPLTPVVLCSVTISSSSFLCLHSSWALTGTEADRHSFPHSQTSLFHFGASPPLRREILTLFPGQAGCRDEVLFEILWFYPFLSFRIGTRFESVCLCVLFHISESRSISVTLHSPLVDVSDYVVRFWWFLTSFDWSSRRDRKLGESGTNIQQRFFHLDLNWACCTCGSHSNRDLSLLNCDWVYLEILPHLWKK